MRYLSTSLAVGLFACSSGERDDAKPFQITEVQAAASRVYPTRQAIALAALGRAPNGVGVMVTVRSDAPGFSHFTYAVDDAAEATSIDGRILIDFSDHQEPLQIRRELSVVAVDGDGGATEPRRLTFVYTPRAFYAANGREQAGSVLLERSELPFVPTRVEDWVLDRPSPEDVRFARAKWGALVDAAPGPYEKAKALAMALIEDFEPHRGVPSDVMNEAPPFEQYERAVSGLDEVWCDNMAEVFVRAAVALGVPARLVEMPGHDLDAGAALQLLDADAHTSTEVFDEQRNRWIWMDLTLYALGAELADLGPIGIAALHHHVNDPVAFRALRVAWYDPVRHEASMVPASDSAVTAPLRLFFPADQRLQFFEHRSE